MSPRTRRGLLALLAGATAPLAGCRTSPGDGPPTGPAATDAPRATDTSGTGTSATTTPASAGPTLVLTRDGTVPGTTATVYPERLRAWLREAATTGRTLRVHARTPVYAPDPVLPLFDEVRLESPDGAADGRYEVRAEGGTRYEWLVGAAEVADVPEDAAVTPVSALAGDRRAFVERALGPDGAYVYPETALGSWVRHEFLGGYFSRDGTTYRGRKRQQTDAAFFSREVWYVLSLSPVPARAGTSPPRLRLRPVPDPVRRVVDAALGGRYHRDRVVVGLGEEPPAVADEVARFGRETDALLLHSAVYGVRVADGGAR